MNPEKQRIAIAEACGWEKIEGFNCPLYNFRCWKPPEVQRDHYWNHYWKFRVVPPDYCNDLNEMHKAEKMLQGGQCGNYKGNLLDLKRVDESVPITGFLLHATAAQRAEAFLRTIGKWEE